MPSGAACPAVPAPGQSGFHKIHTDFSGFVFISVVSVKMNIYWGLVVSPSHRASNTWSTTFKPGRITFLSPEGRLGDRTCKTRKRLLSFSLLNLFSLAYLELYLNQWKFLYSEMCTLSFHICLTELHFCYTMFCSDMPQTGLRASPSLCSGRVCPQEFPGQSVFIPEGVSNRNAASLSPEFSEKRLPWRKATPIRWEPVPPTWFSCCLVASTTCYFIVNWLG